MGRHRVYRPLNEKGEMECRTCKKFKALDEFHNDKRMISSYFKCPTCKECRQEYKSAKYFHDKKKSTKRQKFIDRFNDYNIRR